MGPLWSDLAHLIRAGAIDDSRGRSAPPTLDETSETRRARRERGEGSQPGRKKGT